jgi:hypothetical protein
VHFCAGRGNLNICRPRLLLQIIVIFFATLWLGLSPVNSETPNGTIKVDQSFDHSRTNFPLEGAHKDVTCETCHAGGVFKGVPTACASCHNGDMAKGKSGDHPKTSSICSDCHNNSTWAKVHVDHSKIKKDCFSCHDGKVASGKNKTHVKSATACENCHIVSTWRVTKFDHAQTNEPCEACHDRIHATGKPFVHIRSSKDCASCHKTEDWKIGTFDHTGVVDGCFTCHDGVSATGKTSTHVPTSNTCETCHNTITWTRVTFDHTDSVVAKQACLDCHDGRLATGRAVTHFKTQGDCGACHVTTTWAPATFDHTLALDLPNCFSCHNGQRPPADGKNQGHIVSSNVCTDCHSDTNFTTWKGAKFIHTNVIAGCFTCHNGQSATGKSNAHLATTNSCESCHNTATFVNWNTSKFDHSQSTGATCVSCHNGNQTISTGPIVGKLQGPSGTHFSTTDTCDACHNTAKFIPSTVFDHTEMSVTTCFSCHNGTTGTSKKNPLTTKISGHINSGNDCESCHTSFTTWQTAIFDHSVIGTDRCDSCHNNVNATGLNPATHLAFNGGTDCAACHTTITWRPSAFDHSVVSTSCFSCHNGTTSIVSKGALTTKGQNHIPLNGKNCEDCHTSTTVWKIAFDHSTIGAATCESCHNGTIATGKLSLSGTHLTTSNACITCHVTASWTAVRFDHTDTGVSTACFTCHNGSTAISTGKLKTKGLGHVVTSLGCETCHSSFTAWTATFDHANINGAACVSCHNGTNAIGKLTVTGKHILSSNTCNNCHTNFTAFKPVASTDLHADPTVSGTNCTTCHDGVTATGKLTKTGKHIPVTSECSSCHVTNVWKPVMPATIHADTIVASKSCQTCHNNADATGKATTHISSSANCADCHTSTTKWTVLAPNFHDFVNGTCVSCHDGTKSTATKPISGKLTFGSHISSSNLCASCHTTATWKPVILPLDHGQVTGACFTCHNGTIATTHTTPAHVQAPGDKNCQDCHNTFNWVSTGKPDHTSFGPNDCKTCHAGAGAATHKSTGHFAASDQCATCHTTVTFKPAVFDHSDPGASGACFTCHNGLRLPANGKSSAPQGHVKTSDDCQACHVVGPTWVTSIKIHSVQDPVVEGATCVSCHDGAHPPATPKSNAHFKTSTDCASCHTELNWTVGKGKFNHSDPVVSGSTCFSCHDGSPTHAPALGKINGHLPTSNVCENCHSTTAWKPAQFDHTTVVPGTCFTCHNGTTATGKTQTHFKTSNTCDTCHNTNVWKPFIPPFHADTGVTGTCYSCHTGTRPPAKGRSATHITSTTNCEACHATTPANWKTTVVDHTQVTGTCASCHNGVISVGKLSISGKHMNTTNSCVNCHTTKDTRLKTAAQWKVVSAAFDHTQAIGTCNSCHNGTNPPAVGKNTGHITTSTLCEACHTTAAWKPVLAKNVDHTQVTGTCFSCHNNTKVAGKSNTHITTSNTCDLCHTTVNWTASIVDHTQVIGTCFSCHNGTKATGKISLSGKHFNTSNTCDACHATRDTKTKSATAWPVAKTAFDHSQAIGTCISCHTTGAVPVAEVKSATHFVTTQACDVCHTTTNWTTLLPYSHISPTYVMHSASSGVTTCLSCHKQNSEKITFLSPSLVPDCAACHSNKYKPDPHTKYGNVKYTFTELRDCTGACHVYNDQTLSTIKTNRATNTKHRPTRSNWN